MLNIKLIEVLKSFNPAEFKKFGIAVKSPYFNSEKVLSNLYDILKQSYPGFISTDLDKKKIFSKLYLGKPYNDALMRNIFSDMLKLADKFLLIEAGKDGQFDSYVGLMNGYSERGLIKMYEKNLNKAEQFLKNTGVHDVDYYKNTLKLELAKRNFYLRHKDIYVNPKNSNQSISDTITIIFLIEMLYNNIDMLNIKSHRYDFDFRLNFEKQIEDFLEAEGSSYMDISHIKYYYYTYKLLKTREEKYYKLLKDFAGSHSDKLTRKEISYVFTILTNYCSSRVMQGDDVFNNELFEIYDLRIKKNLHVNNFGKMSHVFFMNVVAIALDLDKGDWVEKLISERQNELKEETRQDTVRFCIAKLKYHNKDYDGALQELARITSGDLPYKLSIKHLILHILFDAAEIEHFLNHVDSYRHFISNTAQISDKVKEDLLGYINFANRIFRVKNELGKKSTDDYHKLKHELDDSGIYGKSWLQQRLADIETA